MAAFENAAPSPSVFLFLAVLISFPLLVQTQVLPVGSDVQFGPVVGTHSQLKLHGFRHDL